MANDSPALWHSTIQKIHAFHHLRVGWHYGEGSPCPDYVVQSALTLHAHLVTLGVVHTDAFPGLDGSISLTVYQDQDCYELTITPAGSMHYRREHDDVEVDENENITIAQVQDIMSKGGENRCLEIN